MFDAADRDPRVLGPATGSERTLLVDFLAAQRATLEPKCPSAQVLRSAGGVAQRSAAPSSLSLLGLLRHLADAERRRFRRVMAAQDAPPRFSSPSGPDGDFTGALPDACVVAEAWRAWRCEVAFAEGYVAEAPHLDV